MHTTTTVPNSNAAKAEPQVALPGGRLMALTVAIAALFAAGWWIGVTAGLWSADTLRAGMWGIGLVAVVAILGIWLIHPQKVRECGVWMQYWLGLTVFRMMVTPIAAYLLYSALSPALNTRAFALAVGLTYITTVLAEAVIVSQHLKKSIPA